MEFGDAIGQRRNKRMIEKLKDHYIICGYGRVGRGAAAELTKAGVPFVIVDIDPDRIERAMLAGLLGAVADSTRDETLAQVGSSVPAAWSRRLPPTPTMSSCCLSSERAHTRRSTSPPGG